MLFEIRYQSFSDLQLEVCMDSEGGSDSQAPCVGTERRSFKLSTPDFETG